MIRLATLLLAVFFPVATLSQETIVTSRGSLKVETMADGFATPWAIGFLPDGGFLVSEREGRLWRVDADGNRSRISGLPKIRAKGQGGLLDVLVPRDHSQSHTLFLTYSKSVDGGLGTAVLRATLAPDQNRLSNSKVIFEMADGASGGRHFGSRLAEARDGTLYVTLGERADRPAAQNLGSHKGKIIRISKSGAAPASNPFQNTQGALPEIWSYGHRNPQGMTFDAAGQLWAVEHGAKGGDEVNRIVKGANYGWPVIAYGTHYSGAKIGKGTAQSGMQQPDHYWDPSIAPSGLMIYSGKLWPEWRGHFFVGSLKFDYISRLSGQNLKEREQIKSNLTARVRDIREAPDGTIWFIAEDKGKIFRLSPSR